MSDYETQRRHDLAEKDTFVAPGTPEGWIEWIAATDEQIEALAKRHAEARTRDRLRPATPGVHASPGQRPQANPMRHRRLGLTQGA